MDQCRGDTATPRYIVQEGTIVHSSMCKTLIKKLSIDTKKDLVKQLLDVHLKSHVPPLNKGEVQINLTDGTLSLRVGSCGVCVASAASPGLSQADWSPGPGEAFLPVAFLEINVRSSNQPPSTTHTQR